MQSSGEKEQSKINVKMLINTEITNNEYMELECRELNVKSIGMAGAGA